MCISLERKTTHWQYQLRSVSCYVTNTLFVMNSIPWGLHEILGIYSQYLCFVRHTHIETKSKLSPDVINWRSVLILNFHTDCKSKALSDQDEIQTIKGRRKKQQPKKFLQQKPRNWLNANLQDLQTCKMP